MSFMKGFGEAFSESYNAGIERNEKRRQDALDKQWELYKERLKETKDTDKANRQDWKFASSIAEANQLPPEAAYKIYEWKQSGLSDSQIQDYLEKGSFEVSRQGSKTQVQYKDPREEEPEVTTPEEATQTKPTANKRNTDFAGNIRSRVENLPKPGAPTGTPAPSQTSASTPATAARPPVQSQTSQTPAQPPAALAASTTPAPAPAAPRDWREERAQRDAAQRAGVPLEEFRRVLSGDGSSVFNPDIPEGILVTYL